MTIPTVTFSRLDERRMEPECMDDPSLPPSVHEHALRSLRRAFFLSRAASPFWSELEEFFRQCPDQPLRGLDLATGGGDLPLALARRAERKGLPLRIDGSDISPVALSHAARKARGPGLPVRFFELDVCRDPLPENYDFITSSLFLHHLSDEAIHGLFERIRESRVRLVLFSDLIRSRRGWLLAFLWSRFLNTSPVVRRDALLSVEAALTPERVLEIAAEAGLRGARARIVWPRRFFFLWRRP